MIPEKCPHFLYFVSWYHGKNNNLSRSLCSLKPLAMGFTKISLVFGSVWALILVNPSRSEIDKASPLLLQSFELFPLTCMWGWWRQKGTSKRACSTGSSQRAEGGGAGSLRSSPNTRPRPRMWWATLEANLWRDTMWCTIYATFWALWTHKPTIRLARMLGKLLSRYVHQY